MVFHVSECSYMNFFMAVTWETALYITMEYNNRIRKENYDISNQTIVKLRFKSMLINIMTTPNNFYTFHLSQGDDKNKPQQGKNIPAKFQISEMISCGRQGVGYVIRRYEYQICPLL